MSTSTYSAQPVRKNVRLRLTRRGRVAVVALVTFVLAAVILVAGAVALSPSAAASDDGAMAYTTVRVEEGQSLWGIASSSAPAGTDVRDYLMLVQDINNLEGSVIHPGQELALPNL
ncbi:LysM peptidoglycan-binding domain-containing protein [Dermabacter vaginalis]|uniref:LysM peptidoglycan-binding domain-containing protein n=1 Tax=Dermabacter vaginalis TaxID=1630135 RepID=A0ABX6A5Q6_9MICO|nr:LysM peptidoglycan-binding domain-containing protein [Dermabacter vaginalis]QEU11435.1 LysM peptidoglycan-binding domain-containing protein [Dermabacter vaginalis]